MSEARAVIRARLLKDGITGAGLAVFALDYNARRLAPPLSDWVYAAQPRLTAAGLARWLTPAAPVNRSACPGATLERAEGLKTWALAQIVHQPALTAHHMRALARAKFGDTLDIAGDAVPLPDVRSFQRTLGRWRQENRVAIDAVTSPDHFKSHYRLAGSGVAASVTGLNHLWMIDASPVDALCLDGRWSIYACIDVWSRRLKLRMSRTPRASAVAALMRAAILAWGVPVAVKTDNGSDFVAHDTIRLLDGLRIERITARAFAPEEKSFVERAIGTFQRDFCTLLPGFIGHSVADRKVIEARRSFAQRLGLDDARAFCVTLTGADLGEKADAWARDIYAHRAHAGLDGISPFARAAQWRGETRTIAEPHALDLLLAPVAGNEGLRTVTKQGVRIEGAHYLCAEVLPGARVLVRRDEQDAGRAWLFSPDGTQYLGEAICPALSGLDPAHLVASQRAAQKALIDTATADIRAEAKKIKPLDQIEAVLRQAAIDAGKLVEMPRPLASHTTPQLEAARAALAVPEPVTPVEGAAAEADARAARIAARAPAANVVAMPQTPRDRFRRAHEICLLLTRAMPVASLDVLWLGSYQTTPEYQAFATLHAEHGDQWLYA